MGCLLVKLCCKDNQSLNMTLQNSTAISTPRNLITNDILEETPFVNSLSRLPIRTSHLIRKRSGSPYEHYEVIAPLGKGSFGLVFKVIQKSTRQIRAMKIVSKDNLLEGFTEEDIEREINILKNLDHPNIIKIYEYFTDESNINIITEYCSEGDLCEKLEVMKSFNESVVKILMCQIFTAVQYLHSRRIIHGDLKLENVMIDSATERNTRKLSFKSSLLTDLQKINLITDEAEVYKKWEHFKNFEVKLIDFGCSKIFKQGRIFKDTVGTVYYASPEVLLNNYNEKCDIWACGVIMYLLLSGELPFPGDNEEHVTEKIMAGKFSFTSKKFTNVSHHAKNLITQCLTYNPEHRISAEKALHHTFFAKGINLHNIFEDQLNSKDVLSALSKYSNKRSKFYQAVLAFLAHNFVKKDELVQLKKIFHSIDTNLDGKLSREELIQSFHENGIQINKEDLDKILKMVDNDNNGYIEYEEFIRATIARDSLLTDENLKLAFDMFDIDSSGTISCNEIKEILGFDNNVADNVMPDLLKEINKLEEDSISFDEFKTIMRTISCQKVAADESLDVVTSNENATV